MPVTAKLSRKFYEQFGDEVANELVNWFNMVDETYRAQLREWNERSFERFDAKLEQRLGQFAASLRSEILEQGATLRAENLDQGATLRREIADQGASLRGESAERFAAVHTEMSKLGERLGGRISSLEVRTARDTVVQTRWMVGLWVAQITAFIGTILIVLQFR